MFRVRSEWSRNQASRLRLLCRLITGHLPGLVALEHAIDAPSARPAELALGRIRRFPRTIVRPSGSPKPVAYLWIMGRHSPQFAVIEFVLLVVQMLAWFHGFASSIIP